MLISDLSSEQLLMLIIPALPNMWALKHAMYHDFPTTKEKYRWMMACVFVPCLAGVAYYFVGRKHASREKVDIRARLEAEKARRAGENTQKPAAEADTAPAVVALAEPSAAKDAAPDTAASGRAAASVHASSSGHGDDWSFGCPDDVRKPQA